MNIGGGLTGLVGSGGPGGAFSPQAQQDQQKKRVLAQLFQAIQQAKQQQDQQGQQGHPSALPGSPGGQGGPAAPSSLPGPQGASPAPSGPMPGVSARQSAPPVQAGQPAGTAPQGMDMFGGVSMAQVVDSLIKSPGNPVIKMQAIEAAMPMLQQQRQEYHQNELERHNKAMEQLGYGRELTADKRAATAERAQELAALEKEVSDQRSLITGQVNGNPKYASSPAYTDDMKRYNDLMSELDTARKGSKKEVPAAAGSKSAKTAAPAGTGAGPDPGQLSDKEERSLDGGKTWWYLKDGKPVQSGS